MFTGLDEKICRQAWEVTLPSVVKAAEMALINKLAGTLVVLDPRTARVLYQARVNDAHPDAATFAKIALAKAMLSWETGLPSRKVQQDAPHLYQPGHTKWGGSAVENKLVVAFSGVQAVFDEAVSWMVLNWILGICQNEMTKPGGVMESGSSFIGEPD